MQVWHDFVAASAVFDDEHLVSCAGLVPVMTLATQTGLSDLLAEKVRIAEPRIRSGSANPSPKLTTVIAGMCCSRLGAGLNRRHVLDREVWRDSESQALSSLQNYCVPA